MDNNESGESMEPTKEVPFIKLGESELQSSGILYPQISEFYHRLLRLLPDTYGHRHISINACMKQCIRGLSVLRN